jgi:Glycosyltransferases involved in cell wall biogenesis
LLSLIIPVYRNEASIPDLLDAVTFVSRGVPDGLEAVFVVDGSPDRSYELLRDALPHQRFYSRLALLSRNFGSFAAIQTGLESATGDRFAVMAADLQEPPELVLDMDRTLREQDVDVVVGVRDTRSDRLLDRIPARIYWALYRRFVVREIPVGGVGVVGCNKAFRDQLLRLEERHSSLVAQIFWLGYRRAFVSYVRQKRQHGRSAWTFGKKVEYLMDSVFSFTDLPLRLLTRVGGLVAIFSGAFGLLMVILRLMGTISVPGYAAIVALVVFFGALNIFGLGCSSRRCHTRSATRSRSYWASESPMPSIGCSCSVQGVVWPRWSCSRSCTWSSTR